MPSANITAQWLKGMHQRAEAGAALPAGIAQADYRDTKGFGKKLGTFGVRVGRPTLTWQLYYHGSDGKSRRAPLKTETGETARYPEVGLADARELAKVALSKLLKGVDVAAEVQADKQAPSFEVIADEYLKRYARKYKKESSVAEDERMLKRYILPVWGERKARDIVRRDVINLLDDVEEKSGPVQRNRVAALVSKVFNVALDRGHNLNGNPATRIKALEETPRERSLSDAEIAALWPLIPELKGPPGTDLALRLLLATGQRLSEVVEAPWSEIDLAAGLWVIPWQRRKVKRGQKVKADHRVPLSPLALRLLGEARARHPDALWVLPAGRSDGPLDPKAVSRAISINRPETGVARKRKGTSLLAGLAPFTVHDLRRSVASGLGELAFSDELIGRVLGHTLDTMSGKVYDQSKRDGEKRAALDAWAAHLEALL